LYKQLRPVSVLPLQYRALTGSKHDRKMLGL